MFRFFSAGTDLEAAARLDGGRRLRAGATAWSRFADASDEVVAQGNYFGDAPGQAEIAFAIADGLQGRGLGDDPARPSGRGRRRTTGSRVFTAEVHAGEPPDDRGVSRERLPGRDVVGARARSTSSCRPRSPPRRSTGSRTETGSRRRPRVRPLPRAAGGRRDRRLARARDRRRPALPQRARRRLRGRRLPGQSRGRGGAVGAGLPERHRGPGRGRPGRDRRPGRRRDRGRARVRGQGGAGARGDLGRVRRDRAGRRRASSASWSRSAGTRACGWSGRTASAS